MSDKTLHSVLLEMAVYISEFAIKHGLKIFLCGGGCIGAIRHKGFIPWDDDLDFLMPRDDYEKLTEIWAKENKNCKYELVRQSKDIVTRTNFINIIDKTTTYIHEFQMDLDIPQGVAIDIFPLDAQPDSFFSKIVQKYYALKFTLYSSNQIARNSGKIIRFASTILLKMNKNYNKRYKKWSRAEKNMSKYSSKKNKRVTQLCEGPFNILHRSFDKSLFSDYILVEFEDAVLPVPIGYDEFLRETFGDYMEMPPVDKRVPHHEAVLIDLDTPYIEYKYKMYLNNSKV